MKGLLIGVVAGAAALFVCWMLGVGVLERSGESGLSWAVSIWFGAYTGLVWSGVPA